MDSSCLQVCLTEEERRHFAGQGYLVVPDALDRPTTAGLIAAVDRVDARERNPGDSGILARPAVGRV
jgi:hypothetical protein